MIRFLIVVCCLSLVLSGCSYLSSLGGKTDAPTEKPAREGLMQPDSASAGNLPFDPMELGPTVFASHSNRAGIGSMEVSEASGDIGYRIQLGAFIDQSLAEKLADRAESELGDKSYVVFDRPFYRVRIGNFRDLAAAEMFKSTAISKGYQDARIARDEIELSKD